MEEMFGKFYLNSGTADVHFSFGEENSRISGHKVLLAAKSDVFHSMFYGGLKENGDIKIVEEAVSVDCFIKFLQYFYFKKVKLSNEDVDNILYLGRKYQVVECVNDCVKFFVEMLNEEHVCAILERALFYDLDELIKICNKYISVYSSEVLNSVGFLQSSRKALDHILKMNLLSCSEVEVFETTMAWVRAKTKKNDLTKADVLANLGNSFYEIRFASMTMEELCSLGMKYSVVLQNDFIGLATMISTKNDPRAFDNFNMYPRQVQWNENSIKCSFKIGNSRLYRYENKLTTKFTTNEPIILGGFTCGRVGTIVNGRFQNLKSVLLIDVEIFEGHDLASANNMILLKFETEVQLEESQTLLPHPILIRPGYVYGISIGRLPDGYVFESESLKTSENLKSNIKVDAYHPKIHAGNAVGLVQGLEFNYV